MNCMSIYSVSLRNFDVNRKRIILVFILVNSVFLIRTCASRYDGYRQYGRSHWLSSGNRNPDWKVLYNTTAQSSSTTSAIDQEVVSSVQKPKDEGGGNGAIKQNHGSNNIYPSWEIIVDKSGGRRNVSGVRRSSEILQDRPNSGHVGLGIKVSSEEEDIPSKNLESTRSVEQMFDDEFLELDPSIAEILEVDDEDESEERKKKKKKYLKKMMMPLLMAYKLKFITMVPLLIASLVLLAGSTGMAGFFFALFAAAVTHNRDH